MASSEAFLFQAPVQSDAYCGVGLSLLVKGSVLDSFIGESEMVRQRKKDEKLVRPKSSGDKGKKRSRMKEGASSVFITLLIGVGLLVVLFMAIQWWSARRIAMLYTPYSGERLVGNLNALNDTQERLWGSYRLAISASGF